MKISEFQRLIESIYFERDHARGLAATHMWFSEEIGELTRALRRRHQDPENLREEFADVLAWLATLASIAGVDLQACADDKYRNGCPRCHAAPCSCPHLPLPG